MAINNTIILQVVTEFNLRDIPSDATRPIPVPLIARVIEDYTLFVYEPSINPDIIYGTIIKEKREVLDIDLSDIDFTLQGVAGLFDTAGPFGKLSLSVFPEKIELLKKVGKNHNGRRIFNIIINVRENDKTVVSAVIDVS